MPVRMPTMLKLLIPLCFAFTAAFRIPDFHFKQHLPHHDHHHHHPEDFKYNFIYAVHEPLTNDIKNQWERRIGDKVIGSYRLLDADGSMRIVEYYADGRNGFRASMRREDQPYSPKATRALPQEIPRPTRDYFGATFVQERDYGRGLGYL